MARPPDELEELPLAPGIGRPVELTVALKTSGKRLDQYLADLFDDYSRSTIQKAIEAGTVTVNGLPAKASHKTRVGDKVLLWLPAPNHPVITPENVPLEILYEDDWLALVNKPFDMVVHPAKGHWTGTLANALAFHFSHLSGLNGDYRPGIVHRLDRDTSGVILVAKEESAHRALAMQFETRQVFKEYLAITAGVLDRDSDYIERKIGHHRHDRVKMAVFDDDDDDAKEACTYYEVQERFRGYTFVRLQPRTGRTHQLRVHLASVGCPVLADKTYSGRDCLRLSDLVANLEPAREELLLPRQALHAARLRFHHPKLGKPIAAEAPMPEEMARTLAALRQYKRS